MQLTITSNFPDVARAIDKVRADLAEKATARALNRTIEQARTQMGREIRSEFRVDTAYVSARLRIKRATFKGGQLSLTAVLDAQDKPRSANLIRFLEGSVTLAQARKREKAGTKRDLFVKVKRGGSAKRVANAFIGNKGRTIFTREPGTKMASRKWGGKHGEQIRPLQTIDVAQMFNTKRINAAVVAAMQSRFPAIFERELAFVLSSFQAGR